MVETFQSVDCLASEVGLVSCLRSPIPLLGGIQSQDAPTECRETVLVGMRAPSWGVWYTLPSEVALRSRMGKCEGWYHSQSELTRDSAEALVALLRAKFPGNTYQARERPRDSY